jgi:hypothetical protein
MENHCACADGRIVANPDRAEQDRVRADIDTVSDDRTVRRTILHAYCRAVPKGAITTEDRSFVHDQAGPVVKPQPGAYLRFQIEFNPKKPLYVDHVKRDDRCPGPAQGRGHSLNFLRSAIEQHHTAALPVASIRLPILKDPIFHLPSRCLMEVNFYLSERYLPDPDRQEAWRSGKITRLEEGGKIACAQCWIFQTWLALTRSGYSARLTHSIPSNGVLATLTNCVPSDFRPPPGVLFLGIVADFAAHPHAHLHIVQNAAHGRRLWNAVFLPLWPHPNLIPRDPARTDRFENVGFFGDPSNLARELADKRWQRKLKEELDVDFIVCGADRWHDYSDVDCVAAVRGFGRSSYLHKPATKLYNAWLAGVPFIGGMDSAYAADGEPGRNFLQASTPNELFEHIRRLKEEPALRNRLVVEGSLAGRNFTSEAILGRWKSFLSDVVPRFEERWRRKGAAARRTFFAIQSLSVWLDTRLRR